MEKLTVDRLGMLNVLYPEPQFLVGVEEEFVPKHPRCRMVTHWHNDVELVLALDGGLRSRVDGQEVELSEGDVLFINSQRLHQHYDDAPSSSAMAVYFHPSLLPSNLPKDHIARKMLEDINFRWKVLKAGTESAERIARIMREVQAVLREQKAFCELESAGLAMQLMKELCAVYQEEPPSPSRFSELWHKNVRGMIVYIYKHFSKKISLEDISRSEKISRSKSCRLFTYLTNETPVDFLNAYRLEKSAQFLSESDMTLKNITAACGFADQSYFGRMFRGKYHCTPGRYRKETMALQKKPKQRRTKH